jgi:methionyl-tRNA formyltransferase
MRIAFMGTPDFAVQTLAELVAAGHEVVAVYSQPPAPRGRGQELRPSPVHEFAESLGLTVRTPASMKAPEEIAAFQALDLDAAVIVAFGQILLKEVLDAPRLGCFNLHASLLPRWRGAAPIQRAIMAGDGVTGVQVMHMSEGLDEGPVLLSETVRIEPLDTSGSLHERLAAVGAYLAPRALAAVERGAAVERAQPLEGITYAKKIKPAEARIDWSLPAEQVDCHIRGLSPFPGAWFEAPGEKGPVRIKALLSQALPASGASASGAPGEVLDDQLLIACGTGAVRLLRAQREGKAAQEAEVFVRGFALVSGTRLI